MRTWPSSFSRLALLTACAGLAGCRTLPGPGADGGPVPATNGVDVLALWRQRPAATCGAACLTVVLNRWSDGVTKREVIRMLGNPAADGYTLGQLQALARRRGFAAVLVSGTLADLEAHCARGRPCIAAYRTRYGDNHCVVVTGVVRELDTVSLHVTDAVSGRQLLHPADVWMQRWKALGSPLLVIGRVDGEEEAPEAACVARDAAGQREEPS